MTCEAKQSDVQHVMKIGILTIATGKYIQFVSPLWESIAAKFMPGVEKHYFLWTDQDDTGMTWQIPTAEIWNFHTHTTRIERGGFPLDTLRRYHYFLMQRRALESMDYLFYFDADMLVHSPVTVDGDLAPLLTGQVYYAFTVHPGFTWNGQLGTYEDNFNSTAYVPPPQRRRKPYVAGGFNGGQSTAWLNLSEYIVGLIDRDHPYIARWHDESYLNAYVANMLSPNEYITLHPGYCYPESWTIPFHKYIIALDKNHEEVRS